MTTPYLTVTMHLRDVPEETLERLFRVLHEMGGVFVSVEHPETIAVPVPLDIPDPAPLPVDPPLPWWSSLKLTQPKTKIYTARDGVKIYSSMSIHTPPQLIAVARVAMQAGTAYDVWAASIGDYICIYDGAADNPPYPSYVLWVRGEDMRLNP